MSVHCQFDKFYSGFEKVVDDIAPLKQASRQMKRLKQKPWLTKGLLKSIKRKNKLFKNLQKYFEQSLFIFCKQYRNALNRVITSAKQKITIIIA